MHTNLIFQEHSTCISSQVGRGPSLGCLPVWFISVHSLNGYQNDWPQLSTNSTSHCQHWCNLLAHWLLTFVVVSVQWWGSWPVVIPPTTVHLISVVKTTPITVHLIVMWPLSATAHQCRGVLPCHSKPQCGGDHWQPPYTTSPLTLVLHTKGLLKSLVNHKVWSSFLQSLFWS